MSTSSETADIPVRPRKWLPLGLAASIPLIVILKMGFFFLLIGMLPSLVTSAFSRQSKTYIFSTVAACNFAGVFPDLLSIFQQGGQPRAVIDKLMDPGVWASMYGAALIGLGIIWISPGITMMILENLYRGRMRHLQSMQKKLEEEWGPSIKGREE